MEFSLLEVGFWEKSLSLETIKIAMSLKPLLTQVTPIHFATRCIHIHTLNMRRSPIKQVDFILAINMALLP